MTQCKPHSSCFHDSGHYQVLLFVNTMGLLSKQTFHMVERAVSSGQGWNKFQLQFSCVVVPNIRGTLPQFVPEFRKQSVGTGLSHHLATSLVVINLMCGVGCGAIF